MTSIPIYLLSKYPIRVNKAEIIFGLIITLLHVREYVMLSL